VERLNCSAKKAVAGFVAGFRRTNYRPTFRRREKPDGHTFSATALICENDEEAIAQVNTFLLEQTIEIWSGARFVIRLGAEC
jgi:hypothetical protein